METKTPSAPKRHTVLKALICLVVAGIISEGLTLGVVHIWGTIQEYAVKTALGNLRVEVTASDDKTGHRTYKLATNLTKEELAEAFYQVNFENRKLIEKLGMIRDELTGE